MTDTWTWATVTQATPLRIKVDGDTSALDATTDNLVGSLAVDDRVRVHLHSDGIIVTGIQGGAPVSYVSVRDYGVTSDGTTDDTTNFQAAWNAAATAGLPLILEPNTTVLVGLVTIPNGGRLNLNGSTIKRSAAGGGSATLTGTDVSNIEIWGGTIDGDKAAYAPANEWRHGISLLGCYYVSIHDLTSIRNKGDGIYVGAGTTECRSIKLDRVICDESHRNGLSIIAVSEFVATASWFRNSSGTNPQAGVDIEPNSGAQICTDIVFEGCFMTGSQNFGFLIAMGFVATARQGAVTLTGCQINDNGQAGTAAGGGMRLIGIAGFSMLGGRFYNNGGGSGIIFNGTDTCSDIKFTGVTVMGNDQHGLTVETAVEGLSIVNCYFRSNGTLDSNTYSGIYLIPATTMAGVRIIGNKSYGGNQRHGIFTNSNVTNLVSLGNDYRGNITLDAALNDDPTTRLQLDDVDTAWAAYTPTWGASTAPSLGNGTLTGTYMRIGKTVHFFINLTTGSTTTYGSGIYTLTLPVAAASTSNSMIRGSGIGMQSSRTGLLLYGISTTTFRIIRTSTDAEVSSTTGLGIAWDAGHAMTLAGTYEAA